MFPMANRQTGVRSSSPPDLGAMNITPVATADLYFDEVNPRLQGRGAGSPQDRILTTLWEEFAVDEVVLSIAASGFFQYEPLFVINENRRTVVIEGNRRLAAVRILTDSRLRERLHATSLPSITPTAKRALEFLPAITTTRNASWRYLGFKHVNGPQEWESFSKAQYIGWVHNGLGVPLDDIAETIGDTHTTVHRLYRALMVLNQAESARVFDRDDRWRGHFSFSHLYTGLNYPGFQKFLGISSERTDTKKPVPASKVKQLGQVCEWLFGSKSKSKPAIIRSQNPDLRRLNEVLQSRDGVVALQRGLSLGISLDISKGDETLFRESIVAAKYALEQVRGKLITGYKGEFDLLEEAEDIALLSTSILEEMQTRAATRTRKRPAPTGKRR
jgi:hypothetical protein